MIGVYIIIILVIGIAFTLKKNKCDKGNDKKGFLSIRPSFLMELEENKNSIIN